MSKTWKDSGFRDHGDCREHPDRRMLREVKRHGDGTRPRPRDRKT